MSKIKTSGHHESRYARSLIEASLDPLVTISAEGKITDVNEASIKATGVVREELIGTDFSDYFTEPQKAQQGYLQVFEKGFVANYPLTIKHQNGTLTDVLYSASVYKDDEGNILGVFAAARDVTEQKWAIELREVNRELAYQNKVKEKRAAELIIANKELLFQNEEKEKRAAELFIANEELAFQNKEKEKRAAELVNANKELLFQNEEKEKRAAELIIANKELLFQNEEKEKRAAELIIANEELAFQNKEKEKRAAELINANKELLFQNEEKEKRAAELIIANKELLFQNEEKEKRAEELLISSKELRFQTREKEKQEIANIELEAVSDAIKLTSQYSRSLIESSLDPLVTISAEGKITDVNEASIKVTGVEREKLIGTDFSDYFTESKKAQQGYLQVFDKGFVANYPLTIKHQNGKLTDVLYNASVYKDAQGNILGVFAAARDVTDQKRIATELTEAIVIAELATGIAEDAKIKAENASIVAEDAVKAKQQFLSNMSHEIRTPLNAIIGFTKVLLKTDFSSKQKEYLTAIKLSGDALIVLINDILDLAKVDSGKMTFEQVPFKMAFSLSAMLHLFETRIKEKNLALVKHYDKNIPEVLVGDPVRLHQIILNLLSNAVKFTNKGKIVFSVQMLQEDEENVSIEFLITDTGIGIPENKIEKIFENFQQASSGTSRLYGGTGLGLAIVKQLVEAQNGSISIKSKIDEGSTFGFILNFTKTNIEVDIDPEFTELTIKTNNINVLVVEDIPLNQLLMKTLLDDFGFGCDIAENGKIAIEKMSQVNSLEATNFYDVILMDLQMPEMNGFEATEYIRNTLKSDIPIIALTADVTTVDLAKCKAVGMNDYISKPVDERLLYSKLLGAVKKTSTSTESDANLIDDHDKVRCIDLAYLKTRTKSNPQLMKELISLYQNQTPPLVKAMKLGLQENDWDSLYSAAHKLIPSFSIVGIDSEFEDITRKIQEFASNKNPLRDGTADKMGIPGMVLQIEKVCTQASLELEVELNALNNQRNDQ